MTPWLALSIMTTPSASWPIFASGSRGSVWCWSKPESFDFLGLTHACGKTRKNGWFALKRVTSKKRLRAKLGECKTELVRRRHDPIPEQGQWLASVVRGHCPYYAMPGNIDAVAAFRKQATRH
jgi:hypothetical protein